MKICHVTDSNCIRVRKETSALLAAGQKIELMTHNLTFDVSKFCNSGGLVIWQTLAQLRRYVRESTADIFHVHNTPDDIARVVAEEKPGRTIWDVHDLRSLVVSTPADEKWLMQNVSGIIHVSQPILDFATNLHHPPAPQIVIYSYCNENIIPKEINMNPAPRTLVYEGGIKTFTDIPHNNYRSFINISKALNECGWDLHIFPASKMEAPEELKYKNAGAVVHEQENYVELLNSLQDFQWGFCGFEFEIDILRMCMPNKLFEYIVAGLPVVVHNASLVAEFVREHKIGLEVKNFTKEDLAPLEDPQFYAECKENVANLRHKFTMESQVPKIMDFYKQVLETPPRVNILDEERIFRPHPEDINMYESESWDRGRVEEHQCKMLQNLVRQAFYHVKFYREEMKKRDLKPQNIQNLENLRKMPIVTKAMIVANPEMFVADNLDEFQYKWKNTGGSTGRPLKFIVDGQQNEALVAALSRGYSWGGWGNLDTMLTIAGGGLSDLGNLKFYATAYSDKILEELVQIIFLHHPSVYRGVPYLMDLFAKAIERKFGVMWTLGESNRGKMTITTSETLLASQRERIGKIFGEVFDSFGANDGATNAMECREHAGLHISQELGIMEIVDNAGVVQGLDTQGIIQNTHFFNFAMPWIRYRSDDVGTISSRECACKRKLPLLVDLKGRVTDYMHTDNAIFNGTELCNGINHLPMIAYQFVQDARNHIKVRIVKDVGYEPSHEQFIEAQIKAVDNNVAVDFEYVANIPLTEAGKARYVISEVKD